MKVAGMIPGGCITGYLLGDSTIDRHLLLNLDLLVITYHNSLLNVTLMPQLLQATLGLKVKVKVYSLVSHTMYVSHDFTIYQIPP